MSRSSLLSTSEKSRKSGFSLINSKSTFFEKFCGVTVECTHLLPTVKLDEEAFDCFLTYINQSLDLDEKFINRTNEKGNYSFFFCLLSLIASCAEGIYASETAVGQNEGSDSSLKVEIEPKIADDGILINHEIVLKSKNGASKGPVEFTTSTRIQEICRSVLEVKTSKIIDVCEEA